METAALMRHMREDPQLVFYNFPIAKETYSKATSSAILFIIKACSSGIKAFIITTRWCQFSHTQTHSQLQACLY